MQGAVDIVREGARRCSYKVHGALGPQFVKLVYDERLAARYELVQERLRYARRCGRERRTLPMPGYTVLSRPSEGVACAVASAWVEGVSLARFMCGHANEDALFACTLRALVSVCSSLGNMRAGSLRVVHGDLKPDNILLRPGSRGVPEAVLIDHDTLGFAGEPSAGVPLGAHAYAPPERLDARGCLHARSDMYSFGVLMCYLLTGRLPHGRAVAMGHARGATRAGRLCCDCRRVCPLQALAQACLEYDADNRPSPREAASCLAEVLARSDAAEYAGAGLVVPAR